MKLYYYYIKDTYISSYIETTNDLVKNLIDKPANKKISILLNYLEYEKLS